MFTTIFGVWVLKLVEHYKALQVLALRLEIAGKKVEETFTRKKIRDVTDKDGGIITLYEPDETPEYLLAVASYREAYRLVSLEKTRFWNFVKKFHKCLDKHRDVVKKASGNSVDFPRTLCRSNPSDMQLNDYMLREIINILGHYDFDISRIFKRGVLA